MRALSIARDIKAKAVSSTAFRLEAKDRRALSSMGAAPVKRRAGRHIPARRINLVRLGHVYLSAWLRGECVS
jgi:hypothetical protein